MIWILSDLNSFTSGVTFLNQTSLFSLSVRVIATMESFPTNLSSTHIFLCAVAIGSLQSLRPNAAAYFIILAAHASIILLPSYSVWTPVQSNVSKCRPVRCRPTAGLFNVPVTTNHLPFRPHTFLSILVHHCCWWISYPIRYIYLHIDIHMDQNLYK